MTPDYQDGAVELYRGDCAEIIPNLQEIDITVTDPPYGMNFRSNYRIVRHEKIIGGRLKSSSGNHKGDNRTV